MTPHNKIGVQISRNLLYDLDKRQITPMNLHLKRFNLTTKAALLKHHLHSRLLVLCSPGADVRQEFLFAGPLYNDEINCSSESEKTGGKFCDSLVSRMLRSADSVAECVFFKSVSRSSCLCC